MNLTYALLDEGANAAWEDDLWSQLLQYIDRNCACAFSCLRLLSRLPFELTKVTLFLDNFSLFPYFPFENLFLLEKNNIEK